MTTETTPLHPLLATKYEPVAADRPYTFTLEAQWSDAGGEVGIDPVASYGYWERSDGSEGGGLWFARTDDGGLELQDYDGYYYLPRGVVHQLRAWGVQVDSDCMA